MDDAPDGPARVGSVADETIRAQKLDAVARLVPGIAHELNNPLAAIVGFAELLRTDPRLPDDMRKQAELLSGETARTRQLVHALLDFLRARPPERHPTSIRALTRNMSRPPGRSRRAASGTQRYGSAQMLAPYSEIARSKLASGSGTVSALPWISGNSIPCSACRRRAVASCASELSMPTGRAPRRASHAET